MRLIQCVAALIVLLTLHPAAAQTVPTLEVITRDNIARLTRLNTIGEASAPSAPSAVLVGEALHYDAGADSEPLVLLLPAPLTPFDVKTALSPDGRYLAAVVRAPMTDDPVDHNFYVWQIDNSPVIRIASIFKGYGQSIRWRPDSRFVAVDRHVYDVEGGVKAFVHGMALRDTDMSACSGGEIWGNPGIVWSPDSTRYVAFQYAICGTEISGYAIYSSQAGQLLAELSGEIYFHAPGLKPSPSGE